MTSQWFLDTQKNVYLIPNSEDRSNHIFTFGGDISSKLEAVKPLLPPPFKLGTLLRGVEVIGFILKTDFSGRKVICKGLNLKSMEIEEASWLPITRAVLFKHEKDISAIVKNVFINIEDILKKLKKLE